MGIVDEDVVRVRETADIVEVISAHTQLKKVGTSWSGLCPFHGEKTPSFSVSQEKGVFYCFGCQVSGDVITFVRDKEGYDFVGAVEYLAGKYGITLRYTDQHEGEGRKERAALRDAVAEAVEWYHQRLLTAPDAATPDHSVTLGDRIVPAAPPAADSVAMSAQPGAPAPLPRRR